MGPHIYPFPSLQVKTAVLVHMKGEYVDLDDDYWPNKMEISEYNFDFKQHKWEKFT